MRVLIVGAEGQLGFDLCRAFSDVELYRADVDGAAHILDIRDAHQVRRLISRELKPAWVFNCAAAHNVPLCEKEPETAFAVNAIGAKNLACACNEAGARLIHLSTDYVFGKVSAQPHAEDDAPAPINVYAASKLAGEHLVAAECPNYLIVRTAALYGIAPCRAKEGRNFVETMLHLAATRPEVKVVTDEITTPTYTHALARQLRLLAEKGEPGLYHATCQGACSWYEFAQAIFEETNTAVTLTAARAAEFQSPVRRPAYSVLENRHAQRQGLDIMPFWRDALTQYLAERV
jgi:dTDP-4-dehydrorhamnose reductase